MEFLLDDEDDCDVAGGCCDGTDLLTPVFGVKEEGRLETDDMVWGPISELVSEEEMEL